MGCYSGLGGVHSQVLHFYVLVFPINIQKCLVITRLGFIYMQSANVAMNCSGKVLSVRFINLIFCCFFLTLCYFYYQLYCYIFFNILINMIISF